FNNEKMDFIWDTEIQSVNGDSVVESVTLYDKNTEETYDFETNGVFIYIGLVPLTKPFENLGILNEKTGYVIANEEMETKDRKSTRLNSSHVSISYAVFCLKTQKLATERGSAAMGSRLRLTAPTSV